MTALPGVRRALVVGAGRSGQASARALMDAGVAVVVSDAAAAAPGLTQLADHGAEVASATDVTAVLERVDLVVPSPGVPERAPVLAAALARGLPVWSDPELAWRLFGPFPLVGVTGTNGKTSVTELVAAMLAAAGVRTAVGGNLDPPLTSLGAAAGRDVTVAELSSFALRFCHTLRPAVGVLLNLAPDHLDWHPDAAAYAAAKGRLWQAQTGSDHAVANADDPAAHALARAHTPAAVASFAATHLPDVGVGVDGGRLVARLGPPTALVELDQLPLSAPHHVANVAAAACAALLAGADGAAVAAAACAFRPGRHRLEVVTEHDGVAYVDDSKATNPHAAAAALGAYGSVVWIAGGRAKGVDLDGLAAHLGRVRHALLLGEAAPALAHVCDRAGVPWTAAPSLEAAVAGAAERARPGDTVLLAPACASFDMFRDYADRGERFVQAVRALAGSQPGTPRGDIEVEVRGG